MIFDKKRKRKKIELVARPDHKNVLPLAVAFLEGRLEAGTNLHLIAVHCGAVNVPVAHLRNKKKSSHKTIMISLDRHDAEPT